MRWRDTVRPAEYMRAVPPGIQDTLDTLEGLLPAIETTDRYVYVGRLLEAGKEAGLLTGSEVLDLRSFVVGPSGWL